MPAATGLITPLAQLLSKEVQQAAWVVLVGPLPFGREWELITAAAAASPLLVLEPNPQRLQALQQELEEFPLPKISLMDQLLAAEAAEQCWYSYNDSRFNGTTPPEQLQADRPNLHLLSLELRPALPLADVLRQWPPLAQGPPTPGDGLLLVAADAAPAVLQGAGSWLERIAAVLVLSPQDGHTELVQELVQELDPVLAAGCLERQASDPALLVWRRSPLLVLQRQQQQLEQQRDQLKAERDALMAQRDQLVLQKQDLEQKLALVNTEVDEILALLDAPELEFPDQAQAQAPEAVAPEKTNNPSS